jgi:hypothetical protein
VTAGILGVVLGALWAGAADLFARWAARNPADADTLRLTLARVGAEARAVLRLPPPRR